MATAVQQLDLPTTGAAVRIEAQVGAARWSIDLDHQALAALNSSSGELEPAVIHRVMENVRAKAVAMRWYGGGAMSLAPSELSLHAPEPLRLEDGSELPRSRWFSIVDIRPVPLVSRRLRVVD